MWKAFREGLTPADLWELRVIQIITLIRFRFVWEGSCFNSSVILQDTDKAEPNAKRLTRLWEEEKRIGGKDASFTKVVWRFGKTRFYVCIFLMIVSVIFQFLGPVSTLHIK